jgi:threonylcarbamoyladenosine tRNA methylthiotransferase MtaB
VKYTVLTFGCRVNQAESLAIDAELRARGGERTDQRLADIVVVNSCSVTATADQGTRQAIRRAARENPRACIIVTGCYATRRPDEIAELPGVVRVIPNARKDAFGSEIDHLMQTPSASQPNVDSVECVAAGLALGAPPLDARDAGGDGPCGARDGAIECEGPAPGALGRTTFTLRVQTGCNEPCSYCVIPSTRGRSRSTPIDRLVRDAQRAEDAGYREITLTGVHMGAYARDLSPAGRLDDLLDRLLDATRQVVFRLGSLEPMDCSDRIIDLIAHSGRVAPALHLPLQHGSDRVLHAMRRPYTLEYYDRLITAIRTRMPHAAIGSDIIVGFPGETDRDAEEMVAYLAASPLTHLHVFPYSDRPGTEASTLPSKVHGTAVRARAGTVRTVGHTLATGFRDAQIGSTRRALTIEDGSAAVTDNGLRVVLETRHRRNEWVDVTLWSRNGILCGELAEDAPTPA